MLLHSLLAPTAGALYTLKCQPHCFPFSLGPLKQNSVTFISLDHYQNFIN